MRRATHPTRRDAFRAKIYYRLHNGATWWPNPFGDFICQRFIVPLEPNQ